MTAVYRSCLNFSLLLQPTVSVVLFEWIFHGYSENAEKDGGMHVNETNPSSSISIHIMIYCFLLTFLSPPSFVKVSELKEVFCLVNRVVYSQWMYVIQIHTSHVRTGPTAMDLLNVCPYISWNVVQLLNIVNIYAFWRCFYTLQYI